MQTKRSSQSDQTRLTHSARPQAEPSLAQEACQDVHCFLGTYDFVNENQILLEKLL